jgi:hypothetical protein
VQPEPLSPGFVDERAVRSAQGIIALVLLAGFVFRFPVAIPIALVVVAIGAVLGPQANPLHIAYRSLVEPRVPPGGPTVPARSARLLDIVATAVLAVASLALLVGIDPFAWALALVEAAIAAVEASTGYNAATALAERIRRDDT